MNERRGMVFDTTGVLVAKINYAEAAVWNATNFVNGAYYVTAKLPDGSVARQKVVVQK